MHEVDFLAWAQSYYAGPTKHIPVAFRGLLAQGLFFPFHPGVFASPAYFCTYDSGFLGELPEGETAMEGGQFWDEWKKHHDRHTVLHDGSRPGLHVHERLQPAVEAKNETAYPSTFVIDGKRKVLFAKTSTTHGDRAKTADVLKAVDGEIETEPARGGTPREPLGSVRTPAARGRVS